jgi:DNA-binding SARP family transcriptional activator
MSELRISLLGSARCAWEGCEPIRLGRPQQLLLGYLVLHRSRPHSRERLAELLWNDALDDRPRRRLNTTLWRLRQSLAPPGGMRTTWIMSTSAGEIGFTPGGRATDGEDERCWIDVEAFSATVRRVLQSAPSAASAESANALETAVQLYAGELLEGCYDDWVLPERRALHELMLAGLEWLMHHHAAGDRLDVALDAGRRLLMHDPLREDVHRKLMVLYEAAGRRGEAIRQYEYCCDVLASELAITPASETEAIHRRLLSALDGASASTASPGAPSGPSADRRLLEQLLGQLREFERSLSQMLAATSASRSTASRSSRASQKT